ncbi:MAG: hypothetical protein J4F39_04980 [Candidatus Latescibacteria bacterium]|nr:hypothetical protein [Candidatus Latescibacterota bacterium]
MHKVILFHMIIASSVLTSIEARAEDSILQRAMHDELARSMKELQLEDLERPYFISYHVHELKSRSSSATFGSLLTSQKSRSRTLTVEVRVGDYALDNTNFRAFAFGGTGVVRMRGTSVGMPLEENYTELRRRIWLATDGAYKKALEDLARKRAALQNKTRTEEISDFSREAPATEVDEMAPAVLDLDAMERRARHLSALFREIPDIHTSRVRCSGSNTTVHYINSEGSSFTRTSSLLAFTAVAATQAPDGMALQDFVAMYARSTDGLPDDNELAARIGALGQRLRKLRLAPVVERFTGPVIFSGQAATELFNQGFVPFLLSTRRALTDNPDYERFYPQKKENPYMDRIGVRVLPDFLSVRAAPLTDVYKKRPLLGGYRVDDEGVPARHTRLVSQGVLETLLTTRTPVRGIERSTGSRRGPGVAPSNILVEPEKGLSDEQLRKEFFKLIKRQKKEYGYIVTHIANPLYNLVEARDAYYVTDPSSGEIKVENPIYVYRVYLDGRKELVRNAQFAGIGAYTFKDIVQVSATHAVYTVPFRSQDDSSPFSGSLRGRPVLTSIVTPRMVLFEDITLKPPTGEIAKAPVSPHPFFAGRVTQ